MGIEPSSEEGDGVGYASKSYRRSRKLFSSGYGGGGLVCEDGEWSMGSGGEAAPRKRSRCCRSTGDAGTARSPCDADGGLKPDRGTVCGI